jgi:dTDP-4-dehydrorhamnose reductase
MQRLELWASPEPTIARVEAGTVRDQLAETGHDARDSDIALIARLGVAASRYPVLWERDDLVWARRRLEALRASGVAPIVTLVHHGSGPVGTDLLDDRFPELLAAYAQRVARAFPWVERWTPINEPLTTARFATLYGLWYPNRVADHVAFGQAITNEALAIIGAMERIRAINPRAQLVLTEDLQRFTAADPGVEGYVAHKRERMYLSAELLMGRVVAGHPLYRYLTEECNVSSGRLRAIAERATPPDLMGFNYYPHSERYLFSGPHGPENLAAVYIEDRPITPRPLLRAAYERLELPLALSEIHVRGTESERAAWLLARVEDVLALRREGVPVVAAGAWAAFGMVDWHSLLRRRDGVVEDGIYTFARRDESPRCTEVSRTLQRLCAGETLERPSCRPWWECEERRLSRARAIALREAGRPEGDHLLVSSSAS